MILETESGVLVNVETSVNIRYGYDIRGEVVGEDRHGGAGRDRPGRPAHAATASACASPRTGASGSSPPTTWSSRSGSTRSSPGTGLTGPSSWDGYAAQVVCDAGVKALYSGDRIEIELGSKPALYS